MGKMKKKKKLVRIVLYIGLVLVLGMVIYQVRSAYLRAEAAKAAEAKKQAQEEARRKEEARKKKNERALSCHQAGGALPRADRANLGAKARFLRGADPHVHPKRLGCPRGQAPRYPHAGY